MENKPLTFNIDVDKKVIKSAISPMFSRSDDYLGYIIVLIDVTKEIEMDKLRSHFISNVSRELRTPLLFEEVILILFIILAEISITTLKKIYWSYESGNRQIKQDG